MYASRRALPTFAVPLLLAVAVLGYLTGTHRVTVRSTSPPPLEGLRVASGSDVVLEYPPAWTQGPRGGAIPGLAAAHPLWLHPNDPASAGAGLEAASLPVPASSPLPRFLVARLRVLPRVEVVSLATLQALRYPDVQLRGYHQRLELYAVPGLSKGEALLACHAPAGAAAAMHQCAQIASSLSLAGQPASDVTPDPVYGRRLTEIVAGVDGARRRARSRMRSAGEAQALAHASASVGARFLTAAALLGRLEAPPVAGPAQVALARSMIAAGDAYGTLAAAARSGNQSRYGTARQHVVAAEEGVDGALESFALLGYGKGA